MAPMDYLTPQWLKDMEPQLEEAALDLEKAAVMLGTMAGLFEHCRRNMPPAEWEYVLNQLRKVRW